MRRDSVEQVGVGLVAALAVFTILCLVMAVVAAIFGPTTWWPLLPLIIVSIGAGTIAGRRWE